ncbi:MAG: hypothetical protein WC919_06595 [Candidatus Paceibacterota bacterium]|jgi:hypothetical protein
MSRQADQKEAARALVCAPILVTLANNLEHMGDVTRARKLRKYVKRSAPRVGEIVISDECFAPYTMHLRMSQVPRNYVLSMSLPDGYTRAMRDKFALFRAAMRAYWAEFRASPIGESLADVIPEVLGESETAFYARPDDEYWIGIFSYLSDKDGCQYIVKP